jgi:monoterpene epsilon-lactone hydrolase
MSWQLRLLDLYLRRVERPKLARAVDIAPTRRGFERAARLVFRAPPYAVFRPDRLGGRPFLWAHGRPLRPGLLLWFHGGIYVMGSPRSHRGMVAALAMAAGCRAGLPDYRLAPEHPFPAAFEDAVAAWDRLIGRGYAPGRIVLGGDSAGGGLALALLAHLLARDGARPAGLIALSPLTDLAQTGASMVENAGRDALLPAQAAGRSAWLVSGRRRSARSARLAALRRFPEPAAGLSAGRANRNAARRYAAHRRSAARGGRRGDHRYVAEHPACLADLPRLAARGRRSDRQSGAVCRRNARSGGGEQAVTDRLGDMGCGDRRCRAIEIGNRARDPQTPGDSPAPRV